MRSFKSSVLAGLLAGVAAVSGVCAAPLPFTASYEADDAPEDPLSNPQWQKYFLGTGVAAGGYLTVTTPTTPGATDDHYLEYRLPGGGAWNPTGLGTTVEISFKTNLTNDSGWGGSMQIATATRRWPIRLGTNFISSPGVADLYLPSLGIDSSTFHTYRFTTAADNGPLQLYVDGGSTPVYAYPGEAIGGNQLAFGDLGGPEDGELVWDYIRWTNQGAFAPLVPEPGLLSLALIGGLLRRRPSAK